MVSGFTTPSMQWLNLRTESFLLHKGLQSQFLHADITSTSTVVLATDESLETSNIEYSVC